jgi:hypothetical protein
MKKFSSLIIIAVLLVLAGVAVYISRSKSSLSTVEQDARNFKFKDTAAITKIFMADKEGHSSTVVRTKNGWVVNDKYHCRTEGILNLLEVIRNVEVKMPVPKEGKENVIKFMASNAIKVEIYAGDELVKQYYVGHETYDSEASYMIQTNLETGQNYKEPYACFIPGFKGYLQPRFIVNENEWRDRVAVNYIPPQMKQIKVIHSDAPGDSSFTIDLQDANTFVLKDLKGSPLPFDEAKMRQYLIYFQNLSYEALITGKNKKLQDSLVQVKPFCTLSITTTKFKTDEFRFFRRQFDGNPNPEFGVKYDYDPDRLFLNFDNGREWAIIQYFVFGKLLVTSGYFRPGNSVKK